MWQNITAPSMHFINIFKITLSPTSPIYVSLQRLSCKIWFLSLSFREILINDFNINPKRNMEIQINFVDFLIIFVKRKWKMEKSLNATIYENKITVSIKSYYQKLFWMYTNCKVWMLLIVHKETCFLYNDTLYPLNFTT